jgi:hypothetical protein
MENQILAERQKFEELGGTYEWSLIWEETKK